MISSKRYKNVIKLENVLFFRIKYSLSFRDPRPGLAENPEIRNDGISF